MIENERYDGKPDDVVRDVNSALKNAKSGYMVLWSNDESSLQATIIWRDDQEAPNPIHFYNITRDEKEAVPGKFFKSGADKYQAKVNGEVLLILEMFQKKPK